MSVCKNCQSTNLDNARFCRKCGADLGSGEMQEVNQAPMQLPNTNSKQERKCGNKRAVLAVAMLLVVLLFVAAVVWHFTQSGSKSDSQSVIAQEGSLAVLTKNSGTGKKVANLVHNGKTILKSVEYESSETSLDGNCAAIMADGILWYCDENGLEKVTEDVVEYYNIADLGGALICQTDNGLFYYDAAKKNYVKVADGAVEQPMISGSGTYVAFYEENSLFRWNGRKTERMAEVGTRARSALGDDGTVVVAMRFIDAAGKVYDSGLTTVTSADGTQRMLYGQDGISYIINGKTKRIEGMKNLSWVAYKPNDFKDLQYVGQDYIPQHLTTVTDQLYYGTSEENDRGLFYLNKKGKLLKIDLATEGYPNGIDFHSSYVPGDRYVYFLEKYQSKEVVKEYHTLHRVDKQTQGCKVVAEGISYMEAAGDGIVYCVTMDNELYRYEGLTGECLLQNVDHNIVVSEDGTALARDLDGDLYCVKMGSEPKKIAEGTVGVHRDGNWFYYTDKVGTVYISSDGEQFVSLGAAEISFGKYYQ